MIAQMSVRFILALKTYPSAGIGRQGELKIRWFIIVNVQVVSWIYIIKLLKSINKRPYRQVWLSHNTFTVTSWVQIPVGLKIQTNIDCKLNL